MRWLLPATLAMLVLSLAPPTPAAVATELSCTTTPGGSCRFFCYEGDLVAAQAVGVDPSGTATCAQLTVPCGGSRAYCTGLSTTPASSSDWGRCVARGLTVLTCESAGDTTPEQMVTRSCEATPGDPCEFSCERDEWIRVDAQGAADKTVYGEARCEEGYAQCQGVTTCGAGSIRPTKLLGRGFCRVIGEGATATCASAPRA